MRKSLNGDQDRDNKVRRMNIVLTVLVSPNLSLPPQQQGDNDNRDIENK